MKFEQLNLAAPILKAIKEMGYEKPSPIQEQAIPPALLGQDVLGCAQTGTGKTAAFALPIIQRVLNNPSIKGNRKIQALILTPTRELALQIYESFEAYGKYTRLRSCVIFGGVSQTPQVEKLRRGVDILVATPGRLNDLIGQQLLDIRDVSIFVLDEADRMLDMGFIQDVRKVIRLLPQERQTLFFSATMPKEITELADSLLSNPVKVEVVPAATPVELIDQSVYFVDKANKRNLLAMLLEEPQVESALVFTRTKHGADRVVRELGRVGIKAQAIHGDKSQNARQMALTSFKKGALKVLVATDIAARGIDVEELSHVFNYDLPNIPETYVHRIGRTGRAGMSGTAISFCDIEEKPYLADIERLIRKKIPVVADHPYPMEIFELPVKQPVPRHVRNQRAAAERKNPYHPRAKTADFQPKEAAYDDNSKWNRFEKPKSKKSSHYFRNRNDNNGKKQVSSGGKRPSNQRQG